MSKKKDQNKLSRKLTLIEDLMSTEQIRIIRANIEDKIKKESVFLTVTSPNLEDQKSLISAKLAIAFAEVGKKVLLVDANFRRPSLHKWFNTYNTSGFVDVIYEGGSVNLYAKVTIVPGLFLLPTGSSVESSSYASVLSKAGTIMEQFRQSFDVVIMEAPSFLKSSDTHILSRQCDGVILVMKAHGTKKEEALQTKHYLERADKEIVGVIYQTG
ncbi:CpsD/CapB family tyrosine-protein kinase [Bacillus tianshenii]|uniref:CpsD/CapB family tyrosine-protein kinase n=1 Tax=Sutcliffiella tianshenii TaxID=1463404 RepID=UPI001CD6D48A|nr:CpsD/CapB family tyrosine-protein kinase [Bacillus tianshenii]MCA1321848.1 CpsD/CapB family tyrosine-protein kinase [Bacillus tianshenii]